MTVASEEGRTVWVLLADVPLSTRRYYAGLLIGQLERDVAASDAAGRERLLIEASLIRFAAEYPSSTVGLWVTPENAARVLQ